MSTVHAHLAAVSSIGIKCNRVSGFAFSERLGKFAQLNPLAAKPQPRLQIDILNRNEYSARINLIEFVTSCLPSSPPLIDGLSKSYAMMITTVFFPHGVSAHTNATQKPRIESTCILAASEWISSKNTVVGRSCLPLTLRNQNSVRDVFFQ